MRFSWNVSAIRSLGTQAALMLLGSIPLASTSAQDDFALAVPKSMGVMKVPSDNPVTKAKVELGKQLYFEPRLSRDNTISCASCHDPEKGWSNGEQFATGFNKQVGGRNSPTVLNTGFQRFQFWDGRAGSLEEQALGPIQNPIEMNLTLEEAVERLKAIPAYRKQFQEVFGTDVTAEGIGKAIAAFERTVISADAPYDKFKAGDMTALSEHAARGMKLFFGKANCSACHSGPNFTDNAFHNLGVNIDAANPDLGRFVVSKQEGDRGAFKTPTLREIARSGPYMHDGSHATLEEVVNYYDKGGTPNPQLDEEIFPLKLTDEEKKDLVVFLKEALSSSTYPKVDPPKLPE